MEQTFLLQQQLTDGSWYQVSEWSFLLSAMDNLERCRAAHPDREYRIATRTVTIVALHA